jgi:hypothetical protein
MRRRHLLLSGGPTHAFDETSPRLAALLAEEGFTTTTVTEPAEVWARLAAPPEWDLLTVNALRWRMEVDRYADQRAQWAVELTADQETVLDRFVRDGGGLLALHTAVLCFDGSSVWRGLIGGTWNWERSSHPPLGPVSVSLTPAAACHPVTIGAEGFTVVDEVYRDLDLDRDVDPLASVAVDGVDHPILWARPVGCGRVVTDLLGHGPESFDHPVHACILRAAARWATRQEA